VARGAALDGAAFDGAAFDGAAFDGAAFEGATSAAISLSDIRRVEPDLLSSE
jgi:uncharacterized protein YjbI with pentapeptide repeats